MTAPTIDKCPICEKTLEGTDRIEHMKNTPACAEKLKNAMRVATELDREEGVTFRDNGYTGCRYNYMTGGYND